ncbi:hypothetical protein [Streptomyces sp. NPDC002221]|uniref:hypothetical protein n=1 Tax=Streptomyces sp. NPDC002221 TaxID=3364639 RepID=UPI0036C2C1F6
MLPNPSTSVWTEPAVLTATGCTDIQLAEFDQLAAASTTNGREFRASRVAVGDFLNALFGAPGNSGARALAVDAHVRALAERRHLAPWTLRKARMVAHRWQGDLREKVLGSPVYVSFSVLHLAAQGDSAAGDFDPELFARKSQALLTAMQEAEAANVFEVSETDFLKALRKAPGASRKADVQRQRRAITETVHGFENRHPEARAAVLGAVKADRDATRAIAASYLMERPALARAVLREEPELAAVAAAERAPHPDNAGVREQEDATMLHELVQVLGGGKPSDDLLLAEWREDFAQALGRFSSFISSWYPADEVTEKADDDLVKVVEFLSRDVSEWAMAISESRKPGLRLVGRQS